MLRSLVGSEMCIRDRLSGVAVKAGAVAVFELLDFGGEDGFVDFEVCGRGDEEFGVGGVGLFGGGEEGLDVAFGDLEATDHGVGEDVAHLDGELEIGAAGVVGDNLWYGIGLLGGGDRGEEGGRGDKGE